MYLITAAHKCIQNVKKEIHHCLSLHANYFTNLKMLSQVINLQKFTNGTIDLVTVLYEDLQNVTLGINQHSIYPSGQVSIHGSQK